MEKAIQTIREVLRLAKCPAVLTSFGKDSMLLLRLALDVQPNLPCIWFRTGQPEYFAKQVIKQWQLTVYSYLPATTYLLIGDESAVVSEYSFGDDMLPVISDVGEGACVHRPPEFLPRLHLPFDVVLVGWKDGDNHWAKGSAPLATDGFPIGTSRLYAPLRHLTDDQVLAAIRALNIPYEPVDDALALCSTCRAQLPIVPIKAFRQRFGLEA